MISKTKKKIKQRGNRTHGWGSQKKHRGAGSRGGKGNAGSSKHNKLKFWKSGKSMGKTGFVSLKQRKGIRSCFINLGDVVRLAEGKKEINLVELGYDKVLGKGNISVPLKITAQSFSPRAREKIEAANGKAIALVPAEEEFEELAEKVTKEGSK